MEAIDSFPPGSDTAPQQPQEEQKPPQKRKRARTGCVACRAARRKCDETDPCSYCVRRSLVCEGIGKVFVVPRKQGTKPVLKSSKEPGPSSASNESETPSPRALYANEDGFQPRGLLSSERSGLVSPSTSTSHQHQLDEAAISHASLSLPTPLAFAAQHPAAQQQHAHHQSQQHDPQASMSMPTPPTGAFNMAAYNHATSIQPDLDSGEYNPHQPFSGVTNAFDWASLFNAALPSQVMFGLPAFGDDDFLFNGGTDSPDAFSTRTAGMFLEGQGDNRAPALAKPPTPAPFSTSTQHVAEPLADMDMLSYIQSNNADLLAAFYRECCVTLAPFTPSSGGEIGSLLAKFGRPQSGLHLLMLAMASCQGKLPSKELSIPFAAPLYHLAVARLAQDELDPTFANSDEHLASVILGSLYELFDTGLQDPSIGWLGRGGDILRVRLSKHEDQGPSFALLAQLYVWMEILTSSSALEPVPHPSVFSFLESYTPNPHGVCVFEDVQLITAEVLSLVANTSRLISRRQRGQLGAEELASEATNIAACLAVARLPIRGAHRGVHPFQHHASFSAIQAAAFLHLEAGLLQKPSSDPAVARHVDAIVNVTKLLPNGVQGPQAALAWPAYVASLHVSTQAQMDALKARMEAMASDFGQSSAMTCLSAAERTWRREQEWQRVGGPNPQGFRSVIRERRWNRPLWF